MCVYFFQLFITFLFVLALVLLETLVEVLKQTFKGYKLTYVYAPLIEPNKFVEELDSQNMKYENSLQL